MTDMAELKAAAEALDSADLEIEDADDGFLVSTVFMHVLMKWSDQTEAVLALIARLEAAEEVVEAARLVHEVDGEDHYQDGGAWCRWCFRTPWPCPYELLAQALREHADG